MERDDRLDRMEAHFYDPKLWRHRAEEARNVADSLDDPDRKRTMLKIAEEYERLAEVAAQLFRSQLYLCREHK